MLLDLLSGKLREPAECVIRVGRDGAEIADLYPFLTEVVVETGRHEAWQATLRLDSRRDENGRWSVQDAGVFRPWEPIVVEAAFGSLVEEVFRGFVRQVRAEYPEEPGASQVSVECQDASLALDRLHQRTVWGGDAPVDDRTIATTILARHGLALHPESGDGLSGLVLSQNATDARFLAQRAEANGYELIYGGDGVYFGPLRAGAEPQATLLVYAGPDTNCLRLTVDADGHQPDRVAFDLAARQGAERVERVVAPDVAPLGPEPASGAAGLDDFVWRLDRPGGASEEELEARARGRANELAMKVRADGELDGSLYGHVLRPGLPVPVDGAGDWLSGTYYVDTVTHRFDRDGYRQAFRLLRNAYGDDLAAGSNPLAGVL